MCFYFHLIFGLETQRGGGVCMAITAYKFLTKTTFTAVLCLHLEFKIKEI